MGLFELHTSKEEVKKRKKNNDRRGDCSKTTTAAAAHRTGWFFAEEIFSIRDGAEGMLLMRYIGTIYHNIRT